MILPLLALILQISSSSAQGITLPNGEVVRAYDQPTPKSSELDLKKFFKDVEAPLAFDLPDEGRVIQGTITNDVGTLEIFAWLERRRLRQADGAYVAYRTSINGSGPVSGQREQQMYSWLDRLQQDNPAQASALIHGGVNLASLDDEGQAMFGSLWSGVSHAYEGMQAGVPVTVSLNIFPFPRRNGVAVSSNAAVMAIAGVASRAKVNTFPKTARTIQPFVPKTDGELDFGDGAVLSLVKLANKASATYNFGFQVDPRAASTLIFVKGKFTQERIMTTLRLLGEGGPALLIVPSMDKNTLDGLKRKVLENCLRGQTDGEATALKRFLDNPGSVTSSTLLQYGFKADVASQANSVGLGMVFTISSNINTVTFRDGSQMTVPVQFNEVVFGT